MARVIGKLTALAVARAKAPGYYGDGGGLYLLVAPGGSRSWVYRFWLRGKAREMGLGPVSLVSLAEARDLALESRRLRHRGIDPIDQRRAERTAERLDAAKAITFKAAAEQYIDAHRARWKNIKHAELWANSLSIHAHPVIGDLPVQAVDLPLVMNVLEPIWTLKPETAGRVRGRIEAILDWARVRGFRHGENPARWRGHLDKLLATHSRTRNVRHHAALPFTEIGEFMVDLEEQGGTAARGLEFTILSAARTGEVIGARWSEIDLVTRTWTIPGARMKGGRAHRAPLCPRAAEILEQLRGSDVPTPDGFVFPGSKAGHGLSNMAFLAVLHRMGRADITTHGFRSTFRDWAAERTSYPREVCEMALAHVVADKVEAAYRRGDLFEKRRRLMNEWGRFCATVAPVSGDVATLRPAR